jgi:HK97 family phage major capsid protein
LKIDQAKFRRLAPADKLAAVRGQRAERFFQVDRAAAIDEAARTVWLSIASDAPYERWWGIEILDMQKSSIRDERLRSGAALLVGHDPADQVGVVESYEITRDSKLRILARFGRSARAEEIFRDVLEGIRCNASVGYIIHDLVLEKQDGDVATYRVTDWEPLEGSLVSIPADPSVGVGRAAIQPQHERTHSMNHDSTALDLERKRVSDLIAAGAQYREHGGPEVAAALVTNPHGTMDQFRDKMLARIATRGAPTNTAAPYEAPYSFGSGARHVLSNRKLRVFRGEHGERQAHAFGMFLAAQIPGREDAARWCRENGMMQQRYINSGTSSEGGYLVPAELASELIKNMDTYGIFRREARSWPMGSDALEVPTRESGVTARFVANDTETTASAPGYGAVNLVAKEVMAVTNISRATMDDSLVDIGDHVAFEITEAFAKLEDECGFIGDGTSTYGGMTGLKNKLAVGSKLTAATNHDTAAEIDNTDLANLMALLPQYAQPGAKWYMSMSMYAGIFMRLMLAAGGNAGRDLELGAMKTPQFAGFPVVLSPALPTDLTADYTGVIMAYFGDLRRAAAFGDRQTISLMVDPYTLSGKAQIRIIGYERFHIVNHGVGTASTAGPVVALVGQ